MTRPFPDHPFLRGNYAPLRAEVDAPDLVVHGELPAGLEGTLYRNGPNPLYPPRGAYHYFAGDGMVHAFTFAGSRVSYRNRWVRTRKWEREHAAGKALFGAFGNPFETDASVRGEPYNVANTHIIRHANRLLALEEGSPPCELEAGSLATKGPFDFEGKLDTAMTAHPKLDPVTGELHFFAYAVGGFGAATLAYYVADASGRLLRADRFEAPYASMVHDFAITENWVLFPVFPATIDVARVARGGPFIAWDRELPSHLGLLRRDEPIGKLRWLSGDPCYVFHPMNAFEEDGELVLDMLRYAAAPGFPCVDGSRPRREDAEAFLERWTVDPRSQTDGWRRERRDDRPSEFPRTDERRVGRPYRHGYLVTAERGTAAQVMFDSVVHIDHETGRSSQWTLPEGDTVSEPVFVPRTPEADEGDGWLLAVVFRAAEGRSDLVVLDAGAVEGGPVATAALDTRVPNGFHGSFSPAAA